MLTDIKDTVKDTAYALTHLGEVKKSIDHAIDEKGASYVAGCITGELILNAVGGGFVAKAAKSSESMVGAAKISPLLKKESKLEQIVEKSTKGEEKSSVTAARSNQGADSRIDEAKHSGDGVICQTSYGKSSENLNWNTIISKKGETRVDHINRHAVPNNSRETHGVFNGNPVDMVNEAWQQRDMVEPLSDGMGGTIYNIPYKNAGYESGYVNTGAEMDYITIVVMDESNDLITAFPSFGDYSK